MLVSFTFSAPKVPVDPEALQPLDKVPRCHTSLCPAPGPCVAMVLLGGRQNDGAPKILIPGTWEYVRLQNKGELRLQMESVLPIS